MELKPCYGKCERCVWFYNGGCSEWNGTKEENDELKPCPFCGGEAGIIVRPCIGYSKRSRDSVQYIVQCDSKLCIGRTTKRYRSEAEAVKAWNRRVGEGEKNGN